MLDPPELSRHESPVSPSLVVFVEWDGAPRAFGDFSIDLFLFF